MAGDLSGMRARAGESDPRYERARERLRQTQQASLDRRAKKKSEQDRNRLERDLAAQEIKAQKDRDKRQFGYDSSLATQRAFQQADAQAADFRNQLKLNDQQQKGTLKRDSMQARYEAALARQQAQQQADRDARQFGYGQLEAQQAFDNQMTRDAAQNQFTNQRDYMQFGYDTLRSDQQQEQQRQRDTLLNEFGVQQDQRQQQNAIERARLDQEFTQQNMYQREASEIAAKWQDQVAFAKNSGLDFSERQKKEIQDLDAAFRKNVLNGPYSDLIKQQAFVEHQKKLAAIIPEQRVISKEQDFQSGVHFDKDSQMLWRRTTNARGQNEWEPVAMAGGDSAGADKQQQQQQKQEEAVQKADYDRLEKFNKILDGIRSEELPGAMGLKYPDEKAAMAEAMKRFKPYEDHYRSRYGLPPMAPYQEQMDAEKAQEAAAIEAEKARQQSAIDAVKPDPKKMARLNPWNEYLRERAAKKAPPPGTSDVNTARQTGVDHSDPRNATTPPVLLHDKPMSASVRTRLAATPGTFELDRFREKHDGQDHRSRTIRLAADILINSIIMKDTSDPNLPEALRVLEKAGYTHKQPGKK